MLELVVRVVLEPDGGARRPLGVLECSALCDEREYNTVSSSVDEAGPRDVRARVRTLVAMHRRWISWPFASLTNRMPSVILESGPVGCACGQLPVGATSREEPARERAGERMGEGERDRDALGAGLPTSLGPPPSTRSSLVVTSIVELIMHFASSVSVTEHRWQNESHSHSCVPREGEEEGQGEHVSHKDRRTTAGELKAHLVVVLDLVVHALGDEGHEPEAVREHLVGHDARVLGDLDLVNGERVDARDHASPDRVGEAAGRAHGARVSRGRPRREGGGGGDGPEVDAVEDELDVAVFGQLCDLDAQVGAVVGGRRLERELANNALHDEEAREVDRGRVAVRTRLDAAWIELGEVRGCRAGSGLSSASRGAVVEGRGERRSRLPLSRPRRSPRPLSWRECLSVEGVPYILVDQLPAAEPAAGKAQFDRLAW